MPSSDLHRSIETETELAQLWDLIRELQSASDSAPGWMSDFSGLGAFIARLENAYERALKRLEKEGVL